MGATEKNRYGYVRHLPGIRFEVALAGVRDALVAEGFGVMSRIDVDETLRERLGVDFRRYAILGACNPRIAHRALYAEEHIGLLFPCHVVVQEHEGGSTISAADPQVVLRLIDNPELDPIAAETAERLRRVLKRAS